MDDLRPVEVEYKTSYDRRSHRETGIFHRWGERLNQINDTAVGAAEVVAIVELEDGTVKEIPAAAVRFLDRGPKKDRNPWLQQYSRRRRPKPDTAAPDDNE